MPNLIPSSKRIARGYQEKGKVTIPVSYKSMATTRSHSQFYKLAIYEVLSMKFTLQQVFNFMTLSVLLTPYLVIAKAHYQLAMVLAGALKVVTARTADIVFWTGRECTGIAMGCMKVGPDTCCTSNLNAFASAYISDEHSSTLSIYSGIQCSGASSANLWQNRCHMANFGASMLLK